MRRLLSIVLGAWLVLGTTLSGCGPHLADEELGEVQTSASQLPGADEKPSLPKPRFSDEGGGEGTADDHP